MYSMFIQLVLGLFIVFCNRSYMFSLPPLASPAAGHITSNDQLTAYLTSAFGSGPNTVLLFLQDKVSP